MKKGVDKSRSICYHLSCAEASATKHGGIAQLGAHVTSETAPILFQKFAKLAVDNSQEMFYNMPRRLKNQRAMVKESSEKSSYGGIAQLGGHIIR